MFLVLYVAKAHVRRALHKQADFFGYYHFSLIDANRPSTYEYFMYWCNICQDYQRAETTSGIIHCPTCCLLLWSENERHPHFWRRLVKARNTIVIAARLEFLMKFLQTHRIGMEVTSREINAQTRRREKRVLHEAAHTEGLK